MQVLFRLLPYLKPYRSRIILGLLCLLADVGLELAPGLIWMRVIDQVVLRRDLTELPLSIGLLVAINFGEALISRSRRLLIEPTAQGIVRDLREALFAKLARLPIAYFGEARTGDLVSRVSADVEAVQEVVVNGTDSLLANFLRLVGVVVIFVWLNPILGIMTTAPILVVGVLLRIFNGKVRPFYQSARRQLGALNAYLADALGGIRVVKSFAREAQEQGRFNLLNREFIDTQLTAVRVRANLFPWVSFAASFGNVTMLGFGAYLIVKGQFTLGGLVAYRNYGRYFYGPIDNLTQINDMLQRAEASGRRLFEVLDAPETVSDLPDAVQLPEVVGRVEFAGVSFAYIPPPLTLSTRDTGPLSFSGRGGSGSRSGGPITSSPVLQPPTGEAMNQRIPEALHDISFTIQPGQRVALVGESGAGKSTIFSLIARLYDPVEGAISIDGHDLRSVTQASLRRQIVTVQQDTFLFTSSVAENIRFGRPEASEDEVRQAAVAANAHEFIERLPMGYDTVVGERGLKLSGGQRQRLAVARAFLAGGRLLLLDEATSAVEPESERLIFESLQRLMQGKTALIATHRLSTIRGADLILVIQKGRLVERGAHSELMSLGGVYAGMVRDQEAGVLIANQG